MSFGGTSGGASGAGTGRKVTSRTWVWISGGDMGFPISGPAAGSGTAGGAATVAGPTALVASATGTITWIRGAAPL
jgi:hypothetical protein